MYKQLHVECLDIGGLEVSLQAVRLPKNNNKIYSEKENILLASKLIRAGDDHAKAIRGIVVWCKLKMQTGFMIEFETYRHGIECLSTSSSMHNELKGLSGSDLAEKKQADLPEKVYTRIVTMSYQALRNIYKARRKHRHPDWRIFCDFIEELPYFDKLIYPEKNKHIS